MRNATSKPAVARIGEYELIEKVGEGGMAEVWLARRAGIGGSMKSCALKLPLQRVSADERFQKMFLSEARLALKLSHANIVSVFDAGETDDRLYMALEWIDGVDLRSFAQRIHDIPMRFSMPVVCHVIGELLHALRYAHTFAIGGQSLGIIHRDISPQNVLISSSGEVKLSDFGIARVIGEETSQMHVKGKLRYMAPEQFQGQPEQASDIYAVGTILHELLEGHRFRDGLESREDWMRALLTDEMPVLQRQNVPRELVALHDGLLQPDPANRIRTADEALMQLSQCDQWRNSTIELRKMYARYFNVNRRTGLTQGDGMLPALPDSVQAPADRFPTGLEAPTNPQAPGATEAEPDAPVFFRKGARRGRPSSEPSEVGGRAALSGSSTSPHAAPTPPPSMASGSVRAASEPVAAATGSGPVPAHVTPQPSGGSVATAQSGLHGTPQGLPPLQPAVGSGPNRQATPEAFAATDAASAAPSARESTRPESRPEETRPTLGPGDVTNTSIATKIERKEQTRRFVLLGVVAIVVVVAGLVTAKFLIGDEEPADDSAAAVVKRDPPAKAAEPEPKPAGIPKSAGPVIPSDAPADDAADAADTVLVKLRLDSLEQAWVRVGTREIFVRGRIDEKLPPGTHDVAWKGTEDGAWQPAEALVLTEGKEHLVKIAPAGLSITAYDP
ncbi:MAG: protein kinase [Myxococcota bacterium]